MLDSSVINSSCVDPSSEDGFSVLLCENTLKRTGSESLAVSSLNAINSFEKVASLSPTGGPRPALLCPDRLQTWLGTENATMTCKIEVKIIISTLSIFVI